MSVRIARNIEQAVSYDEQLNRLRVNGYQVREDMVGEWKINVKVYKFPEYLDIASYENVFMLKILAAPEEKIKKDDPIEQLLKPTFEGMVVLQK